MSTSSIPDVEVSTSRAESDAENTSSPSTSQPQEKKKKKKTRKSDIPQGIVNEVVEQVKAEHGEDSPAADEQTIRHALEQLKVMDVVKGKAGLGGINKKDMGGHKFWSTQPVPQTVEDVPLEDGSIEPSVPADQVRQEPYPLQEGFEWTTIDIQDPNQIKEVYDLLSLHYIEDDDASFRFKYSAEFFEWALKPPGYHPEWHVGVRVSSNKKLVAFISGVPITLKVRRNTVLASEINYLCIHKKLRSKRLAPVLIKEVTRQCHLKGVFQAIYTGGIVLPTPVSVCRYYHRSLNVPKLVDVNFTYVPRNMTLARMIRHHQLPATPSIAGLRQMEDRDVESVHALFEKYMARFDMIPLMSVEEVRHQFLSGRGSGDEVNGRRNGQVTWSYVVEDPSSHRITDFFSFYYLPSTIISNPKHSLLEAAYLYYYATDAGFVGTGNMEGRIRSRVSELISSAIIIANNAKIDVFNALTLMDNVPVLKELKFGGGDGLLNFYLYNWRTAPLAGVNGVAGVEPGRGVGVVML